MVIALAGRHVDASDAAQKRFPVENASTVKQQIRDFLQSHDARALVVWNGESRGEGDVTSHFMFEAGARGMGVAEVMTL
jgi:hypothetical protein